MGAGRVSFVVAPIVEGHGDVAAVPVLLRRLCPEIPVARPVRFPRSRLIEEPQLVRAARIAAANITERGAVLLVIDADEDCAAEIGPKLQATLTRAIPQLLCRVGIVVREFEAWIVGGDASLAEDRRVTVRIKVFGVVQEPAAVDRTAATP